MSHNLCDFYHVVTVDLVILFVKFFLLLIFIFHPLNCWFWSIFRQPKSKLVMFLCLKIVFIFLALARVSTYQFWTFPNLFSSSKVASTRLYHQRYQLWLSKLNKRLLIWDWPLWLFKNGNSIMELSLPCFGHQNYRVNGNEQRQLHPSVCWLSHVSMASKSVILMFGDWRLITAWFL